MPARGFDFERAFAYYRTMNAKTNTTLSILSAIETMDAGELSMLSDAIQARHKAIQNARRATVSVGDYVTLANIRPKKLAGLRGEVIEIDARRKYGVLKTTYGTMHHGVPLACMIAD